MATVKTTKAIINFWCYFSKKFWDNAIFYHLNLIRKLLAFYVLSCILKHRQDIFLFIIIIQNIECNCWIVFSPVFFNQVLLIDICSFSVIFSAKGWIFLSVGIFPISLWYVAEYWNHLSSYSFIVFIISILESDLESSLIISSFSLVISLCHLINIYVNLHHIFWWSEYNFSW